MNKRISAMTPKRAGMAKAAGGEQQPDSFHLRGVSGEAATAQPTDSCPRGLTERQPKTEREAFARWWKSYAYDTSPGRDVNAWAAWQASARHSADTDRPRSDHPLPWKDEDGVLGTVEASDEACNKSVTGAKE